MGFLEKLLRPLERRFDKLEALPDVLEHNQLAVIWHSSRLYFICTEHDSLSSKSLQIS